MASSSEEEKKLPPKEDEQDMTRLRRALSKEKRTVPRYGDDFEVKPLQGWVEKEARDPAKPVRLGSPSPLTRIVVGEEMDGA